MTLVLVLECTLRAILIAGATAAVLALLRIETARARHSAWTVVVLSMLLLPVWTAVGPKVPLRILSPSVQPASAGRGSPDGTQIQPPDDRISRAAPRADGAGPGVWSVVANWRAVLAGIYLFGLCILLTRLALGSFHARRLVRTAIQRDGRLTSAFCAAPITIGWLRPAIILPESSRQWTDARIEAAMTHEEEHARHRDPLVQWLALLNRVVFWFHPLAWWLERHLAALAEQACDDAVLARGHNPRQYSEFLLDLANSVAQSGQRVKALGMTMPGHFLARRIPYILAQVRPARISNRRVACAGGICLFASGLFAAVTLEPKPVQSARAEPHALAHPVQTGRDFPVGVLYFDLTGMSPADRMRTAAAARPRISPMTRINCFAPSVNSGTTAAKHAAALTYTSVFPLSTPLLGP
jgi:BlaR1 peptidase M56